MISPLLWQVCSCAEGVIPSNTTREFATTLDISATIVAAAGGKLPASYQGFDLLAPLAAGEQSPRKVCDLHADVSATASNAGLSAAASRTAFSVMSSGSPLILFILDLQGGHRH